MRLILCLLLTTLLSTNALAQMDFGEETSLSVGIAETKIVALAEVFTDEQYAWRPAEGVRSVEEVLRHVAGTNYWMLTQMGCQPPEDSRFTADYSTVVAFETAHGRELTESELKASFEHLRACASSRDEDKQSASMNLFGTPGTGRGYLMLTSTHLHEHLGQLVAYARVNGVKPPWSS